MYLQPWQVFAVGCAIGVLIALIVLYILTLRVIGSAGARAMYQTPAPQPKQNPEVDLISKLCFILLARKLIDEVDNDFLIDKVSFDDWRLHLESIINDKETSEDGDNRDQQRDAEENHNM